MAEGLVASKEQQLLQPSQKNANDASRRLQQSVSSIDALF